MCVLMNLLAYLLCYVTAGGRTGAMVLPAALRDGQRPHLPGWRAAAQRSPGKDLVPEPALQGQAPASAATPSSIAI